MRLPDFLEREIASPSTDSALLIGFCLGAPFLLPSLWWLGLLGIIGSLRLICLSVTWRQATRLFVLAWGVKYLMALSFTLSIYPLQVVSDVSVFAQVLLIGGYWGSGALWLALGGGVFAASAWWLYRCRLVPRFIFYVVLPLLWLGGEVAGALIFSVMTIGPGSSVQPYFSFGMMGYSLTATPVGLWGAALYGVWGLSVMTVIIAEVVWLASMQTRKYAWLGGVALGGILLYALATPSLRAQPLRGISVIAVNTQFTQNLETTEAGALAKREALTQAIAAATLLQPGFILLPEESRLMTTIYEGLTPAAALARFKFTHQGTDIILIDTGRVQLENGEARLRATILDGRHMQTYQFDKQYLTPQGEYLPYLYSGLLRLLGYGAAVERVALDSAFRPGENLSLEEELPDDIPSLLFCFESVRPDAVRTSGEKRGGVPFVVHPISHAWFHQSRVLEGQLDTMLLVQALWSRVPIVSAGNMSEGKLYVPNGHIEAGQVVGSGPLWQLRQFNF